MLGEIKRRDVQAVVPGQKLVPTALTEDVQLRDYRAITPGERYMNYINGPSSHDQDFFELMMSRPDLFTHKSGGLVAVRPGETAYATFSTHGEDPFEEDGLRGSTGHRPGSLPRVPQRLGDPFRSESGAWMKPWQATGGQVADESRDAIAWETRVTMERKVQSAEFLLLQRLWPAADD